MIMKIIFQNKVCLSYANYLIHSMNIASKFNSNTYHSHMITFNSHIRFNIIILSYYVAISVGWLQAGSESVRTRNGLQPAQNICLQGWPGKILVYAHMKLINQHYHNRHQERIMISFFLLATHFYLLLGEVIHSSIYNTDG